MTTQTKGWYNRANVLLVGLAMAIGWGIRGNFGHQYGAAFAGCLASLSMCLLSGRDDWKSKFLFFAFFGAIGWGFGATISYMQVISYTESGQALTQWFGYTSLFVIGFLWAALGVAAIALVAAADPDKLQSLFKVVLVVFAFWLVLDIVTDPLSELLHAAGNFDHTNGRQRDPLYWLDANYLPPAFALLAACAYDVAERRGSKIGFLILFAIMGSVAGWFVQYMFRAAGWEVHIAGALTFRLGDLHYVDPVSGVAPYNADDLLTNWPQWFSDYPQAIGAFLGLLGGIKAYFLRFGKFRNGASLIVYMAGGWFTFFLLVPVIGSLFFERYGGLRMTPPRSDDWAGITGVFIGTIIWLIRNKYRSVAAAAVIGGTIGGLGFAGIQWIKQMMMAPGNARILLANGWKAGSPEFESVVQRWSGWQHQNWHSFLEQSYGFVNGIAIALPMALLARSLPKNNHSSSPFRKWMVGICVIFVLVIIPYVNLIKNPEEWGKHLNTEVWKASGGSPAQWDVPYFGRLPAAGFLHLSPDGWYNLTWALIAIIVIAAIRRHYRSRIPAIPASPTGRAQMVLLILLWTMVIGNFERALVQWSQERLLTEWMITLDAIVLTYFILVRADSYEVLNITPAISATPVYRRAWRYCIASVIIAPLLFLFTNRVVYHYDPDEALDTHRYHLRFGANADWRVRPILKNGDHK